MFFDEIDTLLSEGKWILHTGYLNGIGVVAFLTISDHHPADTIYTEDEFLKLIRDPDPKDIDVIHRYIDKHPTNPFLVAASSVRNGINTMNMLLKDSRHNKTFDKDLTEWKKFIDKMYYRR